MSREWKVLLGSTLAVFMALLDVTIVNVAFPAIHGAFPATSLSDLSWVLNAYNVVVAALLVPAGRLADRLGRRRLFYIGLNLFLVGSALCGAAPTAGFLIAARILQAVGAATLIPASFGIVLGEFPRERRATATAVWAAAGAVAAAAGPSLGGVLVQSVNWRSVFFVNLVVALALLPMRRLFRESRDPESDAMPDFVGGALLAAGVGTLALGIVKAPDWGWTSGRELVCWAVGALVVAGMMVRSARHPSPVLEPALFRIRMFGVANASTLVFAVGLYALLLGNILFLTQVWGYSVLTAGFAVSPGPLCAALAAALSGRLTERFGPRAVAVPGLALFGTACLIYRGVGPTPDYLGEWLPAQIVSGTAIGLALVALTTATVAGLPPNRLATGTAVANCVRQLGGVLGIAGLIAIIGTPARASAMPRFEHAWLLMAMTALGAAAAAAALPRRQGNAAAARRARRRAIEIPGLERQEIAVLGHRLVYRTAGSGSAILLVHGLLENSLTWRRVIPTLARNHTVIAPDLFGHGESDAPEEADYSLGGHAAVLCDLLHALGHERATVVGHSLGGGIAMTFADHYPESTERLALIASGGFGADIHPLLRALSLPGADPLIRTLASRPVLSALGGFRWMLHALGVRGQARAVRQLQFVLSGVRDRGGRLAFLRSVRAVIDWRGQSKCALGRLDELPPTTLMWGTRDRVIPVHHGLAAAMLQPSFELVLLEGAGHRPHVTKSGFVAERLARFARGDAGEGDDWVAGVVERQPMTV